MTLDRPSPAANHSAVTPLLAVASTSAPSFNSRSKILACPMMLASMRAVIPPLSLALSSTPSFNRSFTTSRVDATSSTMAKKGVKFCEGKSSYHGIMRDISSYEEASIYMLGHDVMAQTWLVTYTAPQELWKILYHVIVGAMS